eukprot:295989-Hanusia_phi.AAC.1
MTCRYRGDCRTRIIHPAVSKSDSLGRDCLGVRSYTRSREPLSVCGRERPRFCRFMTTHLNETLQDCNLSQHQSQNFSASSNDSDKFKVTKCQNLYFIEVALVHSHQNEICHVIPRQHVPGHDANALSGKMQKPYTKSLQSTMVWHLKLGHPSFKVMRALSLQQRKVTADSAFPDLPCQICYAAKLNRSSIPAAVNLRQDRPLRRN